MISSFTAAIPRFHENLQYLVLDFPFTLVDGALAGFKVQNSDVSVVADFVNRPAGQPHSAYGPLRATDGRAQVVVYLPGAFIQAEEGQPVEPEVWPGKVLGALSLTGIDGAGRFWVGHTTGVAENDERSLTLVMGVSDKPGLAGLGELTKWSGV